MNGKTKEIAERLKGLRQLMDLSTNEMANFTDVSVEDYIAAEAGENIFSFTFLYKCAKVFGVEITELISGEPQRLKYYQVTRKNQGLEIEKRKEFRYSHLAAMVKHENSEPFIVTAKYSKELEHGNIATTSHKGEEFDYVIKGKLKIQVGDFVEILNEGDSIYYDSGKEHGMVAVGGEDCEFIAVVMDDKDGNLQVEKEPAVIKNKIVEKAVYKPVYERFLTVTEDDEGRLLGIDFHPNHNFNFAYDVVDYLGTVKPDKLAMLWLSKDKEERRFTFGDMMKESARAANYFKSLGIRKGDKVMLVLKRHYQYWFAVIALHKIGAVAVPATHLLTKQDFEYRFKAGDISAIVCTGENSVAEQADLALAESPNVKLKIMVNGEREGWNDFDMGIKEASDVFLRPKGAEDTVKDEPMLMYFTSGTTGYPNAAYHSYTYALGHFVTAKYWQNVDPDGLHLTIADTGWGKAAWGKLYGQWLNEAAVFTYDFEKFEAEDILQLFGKYRITTFCAPPTMYRFFIKEDLKKFDFSSLKYAVTAGEALNPEVYNQFHKATGIKLYEGFGQTETTVTVGTLFGMKPKPGSMGRPSPQYEIDLLTAEGNPAKVGETGEIVIYTKKKPCGIFIGYYKDKEKTERAWHDGIYHTGDNAWRDEDGYYWYVGRTDDLIKSSGYRIGPFEIESVIMELPYVVECAITGVPDDVRGQIVKATIVLTKGTAGTDALKKEIQDFVKRNTAPYKYPRLIEFVESLPKTISGKIRRVELRK